VIENIEITKGRLATLVTPEGEANANKYIQFNNVNLCEEGSHLYQVSGCSVIKQETTKKGENQTILVERSIVIRPCIKYSRTLKQCIA
jgi:hypothetical protein